MHPKAWMHISEAPKGGKSCYTTSILGLKDAPMACKTINTIKKSWMWKLTDIAYFSTAQAVAPMDLLVVHFQDHWRKKGQQSISKMIAVLPCTESKQDDLLSTYSLMTLLSVLQVTWNHVHGFTKVGSQL